MRIDDFGFFWNDEVVKKASTAKPKQEKIIPEKTWLASSYLPDLEEAKAMPGIEFLQLEELPQMAANREELLFDIECYPNYFLVSFRSYQTGKAIAFELGGIFEFRPDVIKWIIENFTIIGFNSYNYDLPITSIAINGKSESELKEASDRIIIEGLKRSDLMRAYKCKLLKCDMIDLIDITPLRPSLKTCAGRLHAPKCQDLPYDPATILTDDQKAIVRWYNLNGDLTVTGYLYNRLQSHIELRKSFGAEEHLDLRSKSDPQIAEIVIGTEWTRITGEKPKRGEVKVGESHSYIPPKYLAYQTPLLQAALGVVAGSEYIVNAEGRIGLPEAVKALKLEVNGSIYRMGIGGLHSSEKAASYHSTDLIKYFDRDVTSYYPNIIINSGLYPENLGPLFTRIYSGIVAKRVTAKANHAKVKSNGLKIVINGSFGKMGNKYSILYAPQLLIYVTITGQLSLLMLIEALELCGIHVVSANTDGIVMQCPVDLDAKMREIVAWWEMTTGYVTEETKYSAIYSRDVNNYIAVEEDGTVKSKGAFYDAWTDEDPRKILEHNPSMAICSEAVKNYLTKQIPLEKTITECQDIRKFLMVRRVKGGAVKIWEKIGVEYLGKTIRWYYSTESNGSIIYAENGNRVAGSENAKPAMRIPAEFPSDLDYTKYVQEAAEMLTDLGL